MNNHLCCIPGCGVFGCWGFHNLVTKLERWYCDGHKHLGQALKRSEQP